jgi:hypothetical protein
MLVISTCSGACEATWSRFCGMTASACRSARRGWRRVGLAHGREVLADRSGSEHSFAVRLEFPFAGSRLLKGLLAAEGSQIGRRHVKTLMRRMGIEALYRRPRTTKPEPGHKIYPYLLRGKEIFDFSSLGRRTRPLWVAAG